MTALDYLDHLRRESARFAEAVTAAPPDARVPTCPDWDADDLLWHLGEVQWFWGEVVRRGITAAADADALKPERPAGRPALRAFFDSASSGLARVLAESPPETPAWTWWTEQTVGFIRRRQAHEALVHRLDAELAAGDRTPMDPALCLDGVDEALRVTPWGCPPWGTITPEEGRTVRLRSADTGDSWLLTLARFTGTDPDDGTSYDEPDLHTATDDPGGEARATVTGDAADLDCLLWRRPPAGRLERSGDAEVLAALDQVLSPGAP